MQTFNFEAQCFYSHRNATTTGPGAWVDILAFTENSSLIIKNDSGALVLLEGTNDVDNGPVVDCSQGGTNETVWWLIPKEVMYLRTNIVSISSGFVSSAFSAGSSHHNLLGAERIGNEEELTIDELIAGTGIQLTPSPIYGPTGTIAIADTAVTPGSYTSVNLTVNQQGQITAISSGGGLSPMYALVTSTGTTVADNTFTALPMDGEALKVGLLHDNTTNNTRITVPTGGAGQYLMSGTVGWSDSASVISPRTCYLQATIGMTTPTIAETITPSSQAGHSVPDGLATFQNVSGFYYLSDGDYVELWLHQASGAPLAPTYGTLSMVRVGA